MLSTNAQKSITQAKVWLLFEKRYYKFLPLIKWEKLMKQEVHHNDFKIMLFFPENMLTLWNYEQTPMYAILFFCKTAD